jgi:DNA-binding NarL/FixJ family response regulator
MPTRPRPALRVLLLEDDPLDADLLAIALDRGYPGCEVLRVNSATGFQRALESFAPDVILSNHGVRGFSSFEALRLTQSRCPGAPFILVQGYFESTASESLKGGAADFIRKEDLSRLAPAIASALKQRAPLRKLSERQCEVVQLLAAGSSMRDIARQLRLSVKTVESHRAEAMKRLGIHDLAGLVRYAIRVGIVSATQ